MIMVNFSPKFAFLSLLLLLFAIMCTLRICEMKAFCNERDQQILLCFKHGLTDPSNMLSTWSNKEDCCQWRGVHCDNITGRVTNLSLPCSTEEPMIYGINTDKTSCLEGKNSMSGPLSPLLCHKMNGGNNLQSLDLFSNLLSGGLTNCWENWKSLIHISLGSNSLTGMIPHSMGTLTNLVSLHLQDNTLYGEISGFLRNCQKLIFLDLGGNKFYGKIPNWIGKNVNMKALRLRSNEFSGDIPLQICKLSSLIVLDLANNRLSGTIPHCLDNITDMVFENGSTKNDFGFYERDFPEIYYVDFSLLTKGNTLNYYKNYVCVIDLSSNHFSGKIPSQVFSLIALQSLNLSNNQLMGIIPEEIGNMIKLESLDFSNNKFSGEIPQSMSALSFLEVLNLSFNNLRGQIPLGTQLQSFSSLSYEGNPKLCGTPLDTKCTNDKAPEDKKVVGNDEKKVDELLEGLYMGMGVGFATSFWIVCGSIFFVRRWRHAYFKFLGDMKDRVYVKVILWCSTRMET